MVEALRTDFSVRQICETLGFTRSNLYYHPKQDPCEAGLRDEIEKLSLLYPTYGYRRITQLLVRSGYTLGYKRVARLMKSANLSVSVKRVCQTTTSVAGVRPWGNRLENLDVSRCDQVWVGDITYVRLKGHFIYVCLLMDVFTRRIRGWHISQHLTQSLTLKPVVFTFCEWLRVLLRNRRIRDTEHLIYRSASRPDDTVSTTQRNALSSSGVYTTLYHTHGETPSALCEAGSPQSHPGRRSPL